MPEVQAVWMNGCRCGRWKRGTEAVCDECSGENARRSYADRSAALAACLCAAAVEELRVRAAVARCNAQRVLVKT